MTIAQPIPVGSKQVLLSLSDAESRPGVSIQLEAVPMLPFLPRGLVLWGVTDETFVTRIQVGNRTEGDVAWSSRIPGRYFTVGKTFEELHALAAVGELESAVELRQILELGEVDPGVVLRLDVTGPFTAACFWGLTRDGKPPPLRSRIERVTVSGPLRPEEIREERWVGELITCSLGGDRVVYEVSGPSAEVVGTLLAAQSIAFARH